MKTITIKQTTYAEVSKKIIARGLELASAIEAGSDDKAALAEYRAIHCCSEMAAFLDCSTAIADRLGYVTISNIPDAVFDCFVKYLKQWLGEKEAARRSKRYWFSTNKNAHKVETGTYAYERLNGGPTSDTIRARELLAGAYGRPIQVTMDEYALLMGFIEYRENFAGK